MSMFAEALSISLGVSQMYSFFLFFSFDVILCTPSEFLFHPQPPRKAIVKRPLSYKLGNSTRLRSKLLLLFPLILGITQGCFNTSR
ncbi:Uncharacterized protein HZ326_9700 [Fusarium oxysporum f. sp. albedinis]|nr:Uncharacterized protein HZ326_9700 [Fusarium oxysporum f. sp. albedinis]